MYKIKLHVVGANTFPTVCETKKKVGKQILLEENNYQLFQFSKGLSYRGNLGFSSRRNIKFHYFE